MIGYSIVGYRPVENLLDELFKSAFGLNSRNSFDLKDEFDVKNNILQIEAPGYNKSNVKISIEPDSKGTDMLQVKFTKGDNSMLRQYAFPDYYSKEDIKATMEDGILKIQFNKQKNDKKVTNVEIV